MAVRQKNYVFDSDDNLVGVGRGGNQGETVRALNSTQVDRNARIGFGYWNGTRLVAGIKPRPGAPGVTTPDGDVVDAYTYSVVDLANPWWLSNTTNNAGRVILSENNRWKNFFYWIGCGHTITKEVIQDAGYSENVKRWVFRSYRSLMPRNLNRLAFWYRNHNVSVWNGYRAEASPGSGMANVYFNIPLLDSVDPDAELPEFASDAATATRFEDLISTTWRAP